jgi:hypothetical protein
MNGWNATCPFGWTTQPETNTNPPAAIDRLHARKHFVFIVLSFFCFFVWLLLFFIVTALAIVRVSVLGTDPFILQLLVDFINKYVSFGIYNCAACRHQLIVNGKLSRCK